MNLERLPAELLGHILHAANISYATLELLKCGNLALTAKLAAGAVYVRLALDPSAGNYCPLALSDFHSLRYLSLESHRRLVRHPVEWQSIVSSLPATLETLSIESLDSQYSLMNFAPGWTRDNPQYIKKKYTRGYSRLMDMEAHFPRMTTLKISFNGNGPWQPLRTRDLPGLPPTLTSFSTTFLCFRASKHQTLALLPSSLRTLDANVDVDFDETPNERFLRDWAHKLTHLRRIKTIHKRGEHQNYEWLPRSLIDVGEHLVISTIEELRSLPAGIQSLQFGHLGHFNTIISTEETIMALPRHLTSISFADCPPLGSELAFLPKTLRILASQSYMEFDWTRLRESVNARGNDDFWPPHLTTIHRLWLPKSSCLKLLPNSLLNLKVTLQIDIQKSFVDIAKHFPTRISNIELDRGSVPSPLRISAPLSSNLVRACLTTSLDLQLGLDRESLEMLPNTIVSLEAHLKLTNDDLLPKSSPWRLPSSLLKLILNAWHCGWIASIPRRVSVLSIDTLHGLSQSPRAKSDHIFDDLPPKLTILHFRESDKGSRAKFSGRVFLKLPNIVNLFFGNSFGVFPSKSVRFWSQTLRKARLNLRRLDKDDAHRIPPRLLDLALGEADIDWNSAQIAQYWPLAALSHVPPRSRAFALIQSRIGEHEK